MSRASMILSKALHAIPSLMRSTKPRCPQISSKTSPQPTASVTVQDSTAAAMVSFFEEDRRNMHGFVCLGVQTPSNLGL